MLIRQQSSNTWYYVELKYATFAVKTTDDVVTEAPPIARWMVGRLLKEIENWIRRKKGKISVL